MFESKNKLNWDKDFPIRKIEKCDFAKYPLLKKLLEIPDAPEQIFFRGKFPGNELSYLAVVGSRSITTYGKDSVEKLISPLKGNKICVISGLAIGTDGEAHKVSLANNIVNIGIPGSGLGEKVIYPKLNKKLAEQILLQGGLLLSEFPPDYPSLPHAFPARNRIMAALSDAVLVIEAAERSGSLITARLAVEYNRDVLCVPGPINSPNSEGTNRFISEGARLTQNYKDILHQFRIPYDIKIEDMQPFTLPKNLDHNEALLLNKLTEPKNKDLLMEELGFSVGEFLTTVTKLEMKGFVKEEHGKVRRIV